MTAVIIIMLLVVIVALLGYIAKQRLGLLEALEEIEDLEEQRLDCEVELGALRTQIEAHGVSLEMVLSEVERLS